ncbi:MAG: SRPBCC domain-containing protein [Chloroflexi bacterium]|nr:SRPBCC domain-containing protein [Chloroflexota bacterium]MCC6894622.1 SRPBCC domain-containing protein [Anaerolineae bacterium]
MDKLTVERSIWIAATAERVWQAITDPQQLGKWWPPDEWSISALQIGGKVQFGNEDAAYATIAVIDPPREFALQWQTNEKFPSTSMFTSMRLNTENGGTRLNVTEGGFETLPEDIREERAKQTGDGYTLVLQDLKAYVEQE